VERVFADVDADEGDRIPESFCHGVLLVFGAPTQASLAAGAGVRRTIPLSDIAAAHYSRQLKSLMRWVNSPEKNLQRFHLVKSFQSVLVV
jgi:hypothetical protein